MPFFSIILDKYYYSFSFYSTKKSLNGLLIRKHMKTYLIERRIFSSQTPSKSCWFSSSAYALPTSPSGKTTSSVADLRWGKMGNCPPLNEKPVGKHIFLPSLKIQLNTKRLGFWIVRKYETTETLESCHARDINLWADQNPPCHLAICWYVRAFGCSITGFVETLNQVNKPPTADASGHHVVGGWTVVGLQRSIRSVCIMFYC